MSLPISDFVRRDPEEGIGQLFQEMLLERLPVVAAARYPRAAVEQAVVRVDHGFADRVIEELLVHLETHMWAERVASGTAEALKYVHFDEPASPWQMFKRDSRVFRNRLGAAFLKRFPVRVNVISKGVSLSATWKQYRAFPDADLPAPPETLGRPVRLTFLDKSTQEVVRGGARMERKP